MPHHASQDAGGVALEPPPAEGPSSADGPAETPAPQADGAEGADEAAEAEADSHGPNWLRIGALIVFLAAFFIVGELTGAREKVTIEGLRDAVHDAGPWGYLLFVAAFALGELLHVPGLVFVFAGVLAYGRVEGGFLSFFAALTSVSVSFWVVRGVGGQALSAIRRPFVRRILARLDTQPVRTVTILRLILWMAPPLNYALALSSIRFRHYLLGSAVGLAPILLAAALFFEQLIVWL